MNLLRTMPALIFLMICLLLTTGCTSLFDSGNKTAGTSGNRDQPLSGYHAAISQPDERSDLIRMDADVYNVGEVVEFFVTNDGILPLSCSNTPPDFIVQYQTGSGRWISKMGPDVAVTGITSYLKQGESTKTYRFITTGWEARRYRIVSDCGVSHEILLRQTPSVAPAGTSCPVIANTTPYIRVNPVSDQYTGKRFSISGTTSLQAGEELRYSIFAIMPTTGNITSAKLVSGALRVSGGSCGTNIWSVDGMIQIPGDYFIGISNSANTVSAVKRFTVLAETRPTTAATLPVKTKAPGITTG